MYYRQFGQIVLQTVLTTDGLTYNFLTLQWCENNVYSIEIILQIFIFPQASVMWYSSLSCDTGHKQQDVAPSQQFASI